MREQGPPGERGADGVQPKLRWAPAAGYVLLALVLGFLIFRTQNLVNDNRRLIAQVAALTQTQAEKGYQDCVTRNARATESIKAFQKLVAAHNKDGSTQAARVWQSYLDATRRVPLPPCTKPVPAPTP
jgi:type VI protein secretion system component VasK